MKSYNIYELCITSELSFPELSEIEGTPDVNIRFGKVNHPIATPPENNKIVVGELPEIGKFLIRDGKEIIIEPVTGLDDSLLRTVILGPVLCVLLRQRGLLVLHASCININHKGVAFMGGSGWGKSTLATAFHTQGYDVLTDDVLPIKIEKNQAVVFPSYPQFKLCPDAATSLGQDTQNLLPVSKNSFKVAYKLQKGFQKNPIPLQQIYVLDKGNEHKISKLQPQETFVELMRHTRAMKSVTEQDFFAEHFRLCSELIKNVSFSRFTRKPSLADLPLLINLIEEDLACLTLQ
ncbi:hypothetical protein [Rivularia sp. UHCC 0363]|uniref:hypothetical protein n=1 Tax=Rivularia sp. UHCC 0363 TaxID=3110244 RepID=UPI002B21F4DC|nr:hypothetical protein [Rivularia sp. UHCC 0363]MEA5598340.1 hypothetical protein [Rivularia sp. UHCC 0363]